MIPNDSVSVRDIPLKIQGDFLLTHVLSYSHYRVLEEGFWW